MPTLIPFIPLHVYIDVPTLASPIRFMFMFAFNFAFPLFRPSLKSASLLRAFEPSCKTMLDLLRAKGDVGEFGAKVRHLQAKLFRRLGDQRVVGEARRGVDLKEPRRAVSV